MAEKWGNRHAEHDRQPVVCIAQLLTVHGQGVILAFDDPRTTIQVTDHAARAPLLAPGSECADDKLRICVPKCEIV